MTQYLNLLKISILVIKALLLVAEQIRAANALSCTCYVCFGRKRIESSSGFPQTFTEADGLCQQCVGMMLTVWTNWALRVQKHRPAITHAQISVGIHTNPLDDKTRFHIFSGRKSLFIWQGIMFLSDWLTTAATQFNYQSDLSS